MKGLRIYLLIFSSAALDRTARILILDRVKARIE